MPSDDELETAWNEYREVRLVTEHSAALSKREFMAGALWARKQADAEEEKLRAAHLLMKQSADRRKEQRDALQAKLDLAAKGWDMMHFSCDNPDHAEAYKIAAPAFLNDNQEDQK